MIFKNKFLMSLFFTLLLLTSTITNIKVYAEIPSTHVYTKYSEDIKILTKKQVIEDIDYIMDKIKNIHVSCVNEIPKEVLDQKDFEIQNLSESTSVIEEWRIISRILAKFHDAHTRVLSPRFLSNTRLPFDVEYVNNKFLCKSTDLIGAEITEINGMKISEIYENFKLHFSYEIEEWPHVSFFKAFPFISRKNLALAGIDTLKPVEVSFKTDEGIKRRKFGFTEIELKEINPFVSYKIDKKDSVGVFTLNSCVCDEKYQTTVDQFFDEVSKNNIKNVIVDLRENTGGDSRVAEYFMKYSKNLKSYKTCKVEERNKDGIKTFESKIYTEIEEYKSDKNLFDGKIFVLTSNKTFSSAMQFAEKFADNNLATIVGEVPGNSPTSYGDIFRCKAPNSEMRLDTTFKKFYRIDSTKDPERIVPDVKVAAEDALNVAYKLARFLNNQFY